MTFKNATLLKKIVVSWLCIQICHQTGHTASEEKGGGHIVLHYNEDCGYRWRGTSSRFMGKHKGIFHKYWHTHQLPGRLSRPPLPLWSAACVMSLDWGSRGRSLHLLCQCDPSVSSGGVQDTRSLCNSAVTQGVGARTDARSQTHMYILSDIFAVFSADKLDSLASCFSAVFTVEDVH